MIDDWNASRGSGGLVKYLKKVNAEESYSYALAA